MTPNQGKGMLESKDLPNGAWAGGVVEVTVGCSTEADAPGNAVNIDSWREYIENLNEGKLLGDIGCKDGGMLCKAEERDELGLRDDKTAVRTQQRERKKYMYFGDSEGPKEGNAKMR